MLATIIAGVELRASCFNRMKLGTV